MVHVGFSNIGGNNVDGANVGNDNDIINKHIKLLA